MINITLSNEWAVTACFLFRLVQSAAGAASWFSVKRFLKRTI